jgi:TldD protein
MADHTTDPSAETDLIDRDLVERVLGAGLRTGADFSEVYVEDKRSSSANLDDGKVEQVTSGRDRGAGIRVVKGETTGYAHTADLSEAGLLAAAEAAAAAASQGGGGARVVALTRQPAHRVSDVAVPPDTVGKAAKVALLMRADEAARRTGSDAGATRSPIDTKREDGVPSHRLDG